MVVSLNSRLESNKEEEEDSVLPSGAVLAYKINISSARVHHYMRISYLHTQTLPALLSRLVATNRCGESVSRMLDGSGPGRLFFFARKRSCHSKKGAHARKIKLFDQYLLLSPRAMRSMSNASQETGSALLA